jgi:tRNA/rRNA methyltransferase
MRKALEKETLTASCRIVLVRPRDPNNIGAAARAMKNFGFSDLAVVAPYPPVWDEVVSAVNAEDILRGARVTSTVAEAVADRMLVIGTADRTRVEAKEKLYTPLDLSREWRGGAHRLAIVFGPEKHGLTNDDLSHCRQVMSIPTAPGCPSMNLGQAVAICCYELTKEGWPEFIDPSSADSKANSATIEALLALWLDVLGAAGFLLPGNETAMKQRLRLTLLKYELSADDAGLLSGMLKRIRRNMKSTNHSSNRAR